MIREHLASKSLRPRADMAAPSRSPGEASLGYANGQDGCGGSSLMRPCQQAAARVPVRVQAIGETTVKRGWFGSNC